MSVIEFKKPVQPEAQKETGDEYEVIGNRVYKVREINPKNQDRVMRELQSRQRL